MEQVYNISQNITKKSQINVTEFQQFLEILSKNNQYQSIAYKSEGRGFILLDAINNEQQQRILKVIDLDGHKLTNNLEQYSALQCSQIKNFQICEFDIDDFNMLNCYFSPQYINDQNCLKIRKILISSSLSPVHLSMADNIFKCQYLQVLAFEFQQEIYDQIDITKFLNMLSQMKELLTLILKFDSCPVGDGGAQILSNSIKHLNKLSKLHLSLLSSNLGDSGLLNLSEEISKCQEIYYLSLNFANTSNFKNTITKKGAIELGEYISHLQNLRILSVDFQLNKLDSEGCVGFIEWIKKCDNLIYLSLGFHFCGMRLMDRLQTNRSYKKRKRIVQFEIN